MSDLFFPQGVATNSFFCNRYKERTMLKSSIENHENLVLIAPRRYGKTSLIAQVLAENSIAGTSIDFFFVLSQAEVKSSITEAVANIAKQLLPKSHSACQNIINRVREVNPKLTFNVLGQKLEITNNQSTKSISEILLALEHFAQETDKSCVLVLDEFQQIAELKENHAIEAEIRHAVERSQRVSYIFCGSKRHLLNEMFSNQSRPLYHLCDLMTIDRISTTCYQEFLKQMSLKRWGEVIDIDVIDELILLTENHPYYLNALCRYVWHREDIPKIGQVRAIWQDYVARQSPWIIADISELTLNRKRVLVALSQDSTDEPQGFAFSSRVGLSSSAIQKCLLDLQRLDMVYKSSEGRYQVLDPAVAYYIRQNSYIKVSC